MKKEIIAVDIGGTNVRFCRALVETGGGAGAQPLLGVIRKYKVSDFLTLTDAWWRFIAEEEQPLPDSAVIAIAGPVTVPPIRLTNSHWVVDPDVLKEELGLKRLVCVNDFEAMAHGVMALSGDGLVPLFGPKQERCPAGGVTILGPGTGLGVAFAFCGGSGLHVQPTEGGHVGFAPTDEGEERLWRHLLGRFGRVSAERVVSGPGLRHIYEALAVASDGAAASPAPDDAELWQLALEGTDRRARDALEQLCRCYGALAGDLALAHGAASVVLAGGLTGRMKTHNAFITGFYEAFLSKGRHRHIMKALPVFYASHEEAGLFGTAAVALTHFR